MVPVLKPGRRGEGHLLFERNFHVGIASGGPTTLLITSHLTDPLHDIKLVMEVEMPDMAIENTRVLVVRSPHKACREIGRLAALLKGLRIAKGFNRQVQDLLGGSGGCSNLRNMVLISAPLAINASWFNLKQHNLISDEEFQAKREASMSGHCLAYPTSGEN